MLGLPAGPGSLHRQRFHDPLCPDIGAVFKP
jgi:hypothetical protein